MSDNESSEHWEYEDETPELFPKLDRTFLPQDYWKYNDRLMDDPITPCPDYPIVEGNDDPDGDEYFPTLPATGTFPATGPDYAKPYAKWTDGLGEMAKHIQSADEYDGDDEDALHQRKLSEIRKTFPRQKLRHTPFKHRTKITRDCLFNTMVARPVGKQELNSTPEALKAMKDEWTKLQNKGVWEIKNEFVKDWCDVQRKA